MDAVLPVIMFILIILVFIGIFYIPIEKSNKEFARLAEIAARRAEEEKRKAEEEERLAIHNRRLDMLRLKPPNQLTEEEIDELACGMSNADKEEFFKSILIAGNPNVATKYLVYARYYRQNEPPKEAIRRFDAVRKRCDCAYCHYFKGIAQEKLGLTDAALESFEAALSSSREAMFKAMLSDTERHDTEKRVRRLRKKAMQEHIERDGQYELVKSGIDYENFVFGVIQRSSHKCRRTPNNDQGVDLVVSLRTGKQVAVQCKFYERPVSNSAVQEVVAGKGLYGCTYACVVSKSSYTKSAKELAKANGVRLLHHSEIMDYINNLDNRYS